MVNNGYQMIQAIEVQPGLWDRTSGTYEGIKVVRCRDDGDITVNFTNGSTEVITLEKGEDISLAGLTVIINSGTFSLNK